jgi:hypothetical protein
MTAISSLSIALLLLGVSSAAGAPGIHFPAVLGDNLDLSIYADSSSLSSPSECLFTACPNERVITVDVQSGFCGDSGFYEADSLATPLVVGRYTLHLDQLVQGLTSDSCGTYISSMFITNESTWATLDEDADEFEAERVAVRVVSASTGATRPTLGDFACWRWPAECAAEPATTVVNVLLSSDEELCDAPCYADPVGEAGGPSGCTKPCEHGTCVGSRCLCAPGWAGATCATRAGCETCGCSDRGECNVETGECECEPGFDGAQCQFVTPTPAPPAPTPPPVPELKGDPEDIDADEEWLGPFQVFPSGAFTHIGWLSNGQVVRTPEERHDGSWGRNGTGYFAVRVDYEAGELYWETAFTYPKKGHPGHISHPCLSLHRGHMGVDGPLISSLDDSSVPCADVYSWVSLQWVALKFNGTLSFDKYTVGPWLADNQVYALITSDEAPQGHLRAQLLCYDDVIRSSLEPLPRAPDSTARGAAIGFVDSMSETFWYWTHYTAPLDFCELAANLDDTASDSSAPGDFYPNFPLPLGTADCRRIGYFDKFNDPARQIVYVNNKVGFWRYGDGSGSDAALEFAEGLRSGDVMFRIHSAAVRLGEIAGPTST